MFIFTSGGDKKILCFNSNSLASANWNRPPTAISFVGNLYGDVLLLFIFSKKVKQSNNPNLIFIPK